MVNTISALKKKPYKIKAIIDEFREDTKTIRDILLIIKKEINKTQILTEIYPTKWEQDNHKTMLVKSFYSHFYKKFNDKAKARAVASQYIGQVFLSMMYYDTKKSFIQFKKKHYGLYNNSYIRIK